MARRPVAGGSNGPAEKRSALQASSMEATVEVTMDDVRTTRTGRPDLVDVLGTVEGAMTKDVVSVSRDMLASEALALLVRNGVGGAPVIERGRVVGVVTVSDLSGRRAHAQRTGPFMRPDRGSTEWRVADWMTESAVTAFSEEPLADAVVRMDESQVDRLPVVDLNGRPIGLIARDDVVRAVARAARAVRADLEARRTFLEPD